MPSQTALHHRPAWRRRLPCVRQISAWHSNQRLAVAACDPHLVNPTLLGHADTDDSISPPSSKNVNVLPWRSSLVTSSDPPCNSTSCRTIASPSPLPRSLAVPCV